MAPFAPRFLLVLPSMAILPAPQLTRPVNHTRPGRLRILVVARTFPNPFQSWLLNHIEEIMRHGGDVLIAADRAAAGGVPDKVRELGVMRSTYYAPANSTLECVRGWLTHVDAFGPKGTYARRGLADLATGRWRPQGLKEWGKCLAKTAILGLPRPDLVHAHSMTSAYELLMVPAIKRVPLVMTFHGLHPEGVAVLERTKRARLFAAGDVFLANTQFAKSLLEDLGCPAHKIRILPQGINLTEHPFSPKPHPGSGRAVLLSVARLQPEKGIAYAIEAVRQLVQDGIEVEYRIVGDGPELMALRDTTARLGLASRVRFLGILMGEQLKRHYRESHILLAPSLAAHRQEFGEETQGVVIQEAQAHGLIVVATRTGGIPECVEDGVSAFLVSDRSSTELAARVQWILERPQEWAIWQTRARALVQRRFDSRRIGDQMWNLYEGLVTSGLRSHSSEG